jgi:hypothetical protein
MNKYEENFIGHLRSLSDEELRGSEFRAIGATTRLCDGLVQKFFNAPFGEWVPVIDHYGSKQADRMLLDKFLKRMDSEFPNIEVEIDKIHMCVRRKNKTYHELVVEEINRRKNG